MEILREAFKNKIGVVKNSLGVVARSVNEVLTFPYPNEDLGKVIEDAHEEVRVCSNSGLREDAFTLESEGGVKVGVAYDSAGIKAIKIFRNGYPKGRLPG